MKKDFSITEALKFGFTSFFENIVVLVQAVFIMLVAVAIPAGIAFWLLSPRLLVRPPQLVDLMILVPCLIVIWTIFYAVSIGFKRIYLDIYESGSSSIARLFCCFNLVPRVLIGQLILMVLIALGSLALIVPAFFVAAYYGFFRLCLVEQNSDLNKAFAYSSRLAKGVVAKLVLFYLVTILFLTGPAILLQIPTLATMAIGLLVQCIVYPSLSLAKVFVYKKLQEQTV